MTSREWKPGDMARTVAGGTIARTANHRWILLDDGRPIDLDDDSRIDRPLVVIDVEDREQVERVATAICDAYRADDRDTEPDYDFRVTQAALRSLVAPPRPDEPTGLGAVVECSNGRRFVRTIGKDSRFPWVDVDDPATNAYNWTTHRGLDNCTPVRVLSEGIKP